MYVALRYRVEGTAHPTPKIMVVALIVCGYSLAHQYGEMYSES